MYFCYICDVRHYNLNIIISHMKVEHFLLPSHFLQLSCIVNKECMQKFLTYSGLRKHCFKCVNSMKDFTEINTSPSNEILLYANDFEKGNYVDKETSSINSPT